MDIYTHVVRTSILCLLSGCAASVAAESDSDQLAVEQSESESTTLVHGSVTASFPTEDAEACRPLGFPLTYFLTPVFDPQTLVKEEATPVSDTKCVHDQVLESSAEDWASFAYSVLCGGGDDARLCGATASRECALDQLLLWAAPHRAAVSSRDRVFGFEYVVPRQHRSARAELYRQAQLEAEKLIDEAMQVMRQNASEPRDCPDESAAATAAAAAKGQELVDEIEERLHDLEG